MEPCSAHALCALTKRHYVIWCRLYRHIPDSLAPMNPSFLTWIEAVLCCLLPDFEHETFWPSKVSLTEGHSINPAHLLIHADTMVNPTSYYHSIDHLLHSND